MTLSMNAIPPGIQSQAAPVTNQVHFHITNNLYSGGAHIHGLTIVLHPLQRAGLFPKFGKKKPTQNPAVAGSPLHPIFSSAPKVYDFQMP